MHENLSKNKIETQGEHKDGTEPIIFKIDIKNKDAALKLKEAIFQNFRKTENPKPFTVEIKAESGIITEKLKLHPENEAWKLIETEDILHRESENSELSSLRKYAPPETKFFNFDYNESLIDDETRHYRQNGMKTLAMGPYRTLDEDHAIPGPIIFYSKHDLGDSYYIIDLLHEFGHCHQQIKNKSLLEKHIFLKNSVMNCYYYSLSERRTIPEEDKIMIKLFRNRPAAPVPLKLWKQLIDIHSKIEREAWAFALKTLRQEKKNGHDLTPNLSWQEIEQRIHHNKKGALGSYESSFLERQEENPEEKKIKGKFTKKYKL